MDLLLIEDNEIIIDGLIYSFSKNSYHVDYTKNIKQSIEYLNQKTPDLIILDVTLPDGDGFTFYNSVIKDKKIPVLFLTARDDEADVVRGLTLGAEDYMTKPFSIKELMVRVNKICMRIKKETVIYVKDICFDMDKMCVKKGGKEIILSSLELKILHLLFMNIGRVVKREVILDKIWEITGNDVDDHTLTVYLRRIREKIGTNIIKTIKGIGYRIDEE